ncbi:MAG: EscU/YscU/HrcU family type III secretion system export apparatus switch protein, partial [Vampirovibrionales bacterium]|nr:EscU/YscU/HrcU family type III secretion system export apparatus switch protein [Vampirovibrionales bacterium]
MSGEKTEKPTDRKLAQAREQGQVARSADLNSAIVLASAALAASFSGAYAVQSMLGLLSGSFRTLSAQALTVSGVSQMFRQLSEVSLMLILPFALTIALAATAINLAQVKIKISFKPLEPNISKINPLQGAKRFFSMKTTVDTVKALLKMGLIGGTAALIIWSNQHRLLSTANMALHDSIGIILGVLGQLAGWATFWFIVLGAADWFYQKYAFEKSMRMSKQDIKDEHKNLEGDMAMKHKIRQTGRAMIQKQQLLAVPKADVVITNPTHFAIALQYDPDVAPAPRVIAKGVDHFAQKIKEVAKANHVPMVENRPLARSLYDTVEVNYMVP